MDMKEYFPNFLKFLEEKLGVIELDCQGRRELAKTPNEAAEWIVIHIKPSGDRCCMGTLTMVYNDGSIIKKGYHGKVPGVEEEGVLLGYGAPWYVVPGSLLAIHETEKPWHRDDNHPNVPFP